jgi:hypothetical protein
LRAAEHAVDLTRLQQERGHEAAALRTLADVHAQLEGATLEAVEQRYAEARALASVLAMRPVVAGCHLGLGRFLRRAGHTERADEQLTIAERRFTEMGLTPAFG